MNTKIDGFVLFILMTTIDINKLEQFASIDTAKLTTKLVEKLQTFATKYVLCNTMTVEIHSFITLCEINLIQLNEEDMKTYGEKVVKLDRQKKELEQLSCEIYTLLSQIYN